MIAFWDFNLARSERRIRLSLLEEGLACCGFAMDGLKWARLRPCLQPLFLEGGIVRRALGKNRLNLRLFLRLKKIPASAFRKAQGLAKRRACVAKVRDAASAGVGFNSARFKRRLHLPLLEEGDLCAAFVERAACFCRFSLWKADSGI